MLASKACTSVSAQGGALTNCCFTTEERIEVGAGLESLHVVAVTGANGNFCARYIPFLPLILNPSNGGF